MQDLAAVCVVWPTAEKLKKLKSLAEVCGLSVVNLN
jgi:hypothetical protein